MGRCFAELKKQQSGEPAPEGNLRSGAGKFASGERVAGRYFAELKIGG